MNFRPGQKVSLSGTVTGDGGNGWSFVSVDGSDAMGEYSFQTAALTPVVETEPVWSPGDHVQVDGVDYMLIGYAWNASDGGLPLFRESLSQCWQEGRVVVVYRKEADK